MDDQLPNQYDRPAFAFLMTTVITLVVFGIFTIVALTRQRFMTLSAQISESARNTQKLALKRAQ